MGYAIELPLDPRAASEVGVLRQMLETAGIPTLTASVGDIPHVSLGVFSDDADRASLERVMYELAEEAIPVEFRIETVNTFVEPQPVLYLEPAPSRGLRTLHERFLDLLDERASASLSAYYRPELWQPHCTVAMEFDRAQLEQASALVRNRLSPLDVVCESLQLVRFRPVEVLAHRGFRGHLAATQT